MRAAVNAGAVEAIAPAVPRRGSARPAARRAGLDFLQGDGDSLGVCEACKERPCRSVSSALVATADAVANARGVPKLVDSPVLSPLLSPEAVAYIADSVRRSASRGQICLADLPEALRTAHFASPPLATYATAKPDRERLAGWASDARKRRRRASETRTGARPLKHGETEAWPRARGSCRRLRRASNAYRERSGSRLTALSALRLWGLDFPNFGRGEQT
jgi:hypothetical protein